MLFLVHSLSTKLSEKECFFMATNSKEKQREYDEKRRGRVKNWNYIVYPDSAPNNWVELLNDMHLKWIKSPLHDKDVNPTGEPKKSHYHITIMFDAAKTYDQAKEISTMLNTVKPEKCNSVEGSVRYMIHLDNPEKYQYNRNDIVGFGNVEVSKYFELSTNQKYALIDEMFDFIAEYGVTEYIDIRYYARNERPDWNEVLHTNSYEIIEFIKSQRNSNRRPINPVTGEMYYEDNQGNNVTENEEQNQECADE